MDNMRSVYMMLKGAGHSGDQDVNERMILEWILKRIGLRISPEYI
jgi:hypothetical protein